MLGTRNLKSSLIESDVIMTTLAQLHSSLRGVPRGASCALSLTFATLALLAIRASVQGLFFSDSPVESPPVYVVRVVDWNKSALPPQGYPLVKYLSNRVWHSALTHVGPYSDTLSDACMARDSYKVFLFNGITQNAPQGWHSPPVSTISIAIFL